MGVRESKSNNNNNTNNINVNPMIQHKKSTESNFSSNYDNNNNNNNKNITPLSKFISNQQEVEKGIEKITLNNEDEKMTEKERLEILNKVKNKRGSICSTNSYNGDKTPFKHKKSNGSNSIKLITKGGSFWKDIRSVYKFTRDILGGGHFGTVRVAYKKDTDKKYAIKSICKKNIAQKDLEDMIKEVEILSSLDHPNIIKFHETYNDEYYFHLVMDLCKGKDVFERVIEEGVITESKVATIVYKVLSAIHYCHKNGISHRDIKPENILFEDKSIESGIKLIDFGLSKKYNTEVKMHTVLGTPYYVAPEVLKGSYDEKCDIWSIGTFTYLMLCGEPPFNGKNNNLIFKKIMTEEVEFPDKLFKSISTEGKDFLKKCMIKDPLKRITAEQAFEHDWFKNIQLKIHSENNLCGNILKNLKNFSHPEKFKKMVLKFLVSEMSSIEMTKLKKVFQAMDLDHTGYLNAVELEKGFKSVGIKISEEELLAIIEKVDDQDNGKLDYTEFLVAAMDFKSNVDREKLITAFSYFDIDNSGCISTENIEDALLRNGKKILNNEEVSRIIEEVTKNNSKEITLKEFLKMFDL